MIVKTIKVEEAKPLKQDLCILNDTDSSVFQFDELLSGCLSTDNDNFRSMMYEIETLTQGVIDKLLIMRAEKEGMPQVIGFKREKIMTHMAVLAKKKYLTMTLQNETEIYSKPKFGATGFEIKRSSTPLWAKKNLEAMIIDIFEHEDKEKSYKLVRDKFAEYSTASLDEIACVTSVNKYSKFAKPIEYYLENGVRFEKGTLANVKASIYFNCAVSEFKLPLTQIMDGSKIKYVATNEFYSKYRAPILGWIGNYDKHLDEHFKIDMKLQYEKTVVGPINRVWEAIGWKDFEFKPKGKKMKAAMILED